MTKITFVDRSAIRWIVNDSVFAKCERVRSVDGDWDVGTYEESARTRPSKSGILPVAIGRWGDVFAHGMSNYRCARGRIPVEIVARHCEWEEFRCRIIDYADRDGGVVYAPLTHIDLRAIPSWTDRRRVNAVIRNLKHRSGTVLDIGAHWGYVSEELEKVGLNCTAIEVDPENYFFMTRLRRAQNFRYRALERDIVEYLHEENSFDVVLALAIFHHFLKTEEGFERLLTLLDRLRAREMFVWSHNVNEEQMRGAYRNYRPDEIVALVLSRTGFCRCDSVARIEFRQLLRFT